jgi:hypothetical protein
LGGLSKKAHELELLRKQNKAPLLLLDGGGLLFTMEKLAANRAAQARITAEGIVETYNFMGFKAVGIAAADLAVGLDFLKDIRNRSKFAWLSANLVQADSRKPIFQDGILLEMGKLKVAVLGLTDERAGQFLDKNGAAVILPWQEVLPDLVSRLGKKVDLVILLSSYSQADNKIIATQVPGINVILQSGAGARNMEPMIAGSSLLIQTAPRGKQQGVLDIFWHPSKIWQPDPAAEVLTKEMHLARTRQQIVAFDRQEKASGYLTKNPAAKQAYDFLKAQLPIQEKEVSVLRKTVEAMGKGLGSKARYGNRFVDLEISMPDQPEVLAIVQSTKKQANLAAMPAAPDLPGETPPYVGWRACATCHQKQADNWQKSRHAGALGTLSAKGQGRNLDCIPCHVTSVLTGNEPSALSLPADLQQVGCEACHGPGKQHIAAPSQWHLTRNPGEEICRRCHQPEHDDTFEFKSKLNQLGCPSGLH